jgi:WD40 repeat protein
VVAITVASSPATKTWITTTFNGSNLDVWDAESGDHLTEMAGHTGIVYALAVNADGSRIATGSDDGTVRIWDPRSGVQLQKLTPESGIIDVALDPAGTRAATTGDDGRVTIWALDVGELRQIAESRLTRRLDDLECRQYLHLQRCGSQLPMLSDDVSEKSKEG